MAPSKRSSTFSIPSLIHFASTTFRRKKRTSNSVYSNAAFSDSDWTFASVSSETLSAYQVPTKSDVEGQGLYIRFASHATEPPRQLSPTRAMRLKRRIANAVIRAGMDYSRDAGAADPIDHVLREQGALPPVPVSSPFIGTYGQVMEAFGAAGLVTGICDEAGFPDATRLGAMFVVKHTRGGSIILVKLTLWA